MLRACRSSIASLDKNRQNVNNAQKGQRFSTRSARMAQIAPVARAKTSISNLQWHGTDSWIDKSVAIAPLSNLSSDPFQYIIFLEGSEDTARSKTFRFIGSNNPEKDLSMNTSSLGPTARDNMSGDKSSDKSSVKKSDKTVQLLIPSLIDTSPKNIEQQFQSLPEILRREMLRDFGDIVPKFANKQWSLLSASEKKNINKVLECMSPGLEQYFGAIIDTVSRTNSFTGVDCIVMQTRWTFDNNIKDNIDNNIENNILEDNIKNNIDKNIITQIETLIRGRPRASDMQCCDPCKEQLATQLLQYSVAAQPPTLALPTSVVSNNDVNCSNTVEIQFLHAVSAVAPKKVRHMHSRRSLHGTKPKQPLDFQTIRKLSTSSSTNNDVITQCLRFLKYDELLKSVPGLQNHPKHLCYLSDTSIEQVLKLVQELFHPDKNLKHVKRSTEMFQDLKKHFMHFKAYHALIRQQRSNLVEIPAGYFLKHLKDLRTEWMQHVCTSATTNINWMTYLNRDIISRNTLQERLFDAIRFGDIKTLEKCIANNCNLNKITTNDKQEKTCLELACQHTQLEVLKYLFTLPQFPVSAIRQVVDWANTAEITQDHHDKIFATCDTIVAESAAKILQNCVTKYEIISNDLITPLQLWNQENEIRELKREKSNTHLPN